MISTGASGKLARIFWAKSRSFASLRMTNLLGVKKQIPHFVRDVIRFQNDMREVVAGAEAGGVLSVHVFDRFLGGNCQLRTGPAAD